MAPAEQPEDEVHGGDLDGERDDDLGLEPDDDDLGLEPDDDLEASGDDLDAGIGLGDDDELPDEDDGSLRLDIFAGEQAGAEAETGDEDVDDDEHEDESVLVRMVSGEEGDIDDVKEGEFICRSCYLVKGPAQLADVQAQLCRDCV